MTKQQIKFIISKLYNFEIKSIRSLCLQKKKKYGKLKNISKTHFKKVIIRFKGDSNIDFFNS